MRRFGYAAGLLAALMMLSACDDGESALAPPVEGTIEGAVRIDGEGAAGVTVELTGGESPRSTTTSASGSFSFPAVPAGAYQVAISGYPEGVSFPSTSTSAVVAASGGTTSVNFQGATTRTSSIITSVSSNGEGLAGVAVTISGAASATGQTGANGLFIAGNLPAGSYTVSIAGYPGNATFPEGTSQTVELATGAAASVNFGGEIPSNISVAVSSITELNTGVVVDPNDVSGVIAVTLAVDPGEETPGRLVAHVADGDGDSVQVYRQDWTDGTGIDGETVATEEGPDLAAPFTVTFPVDTRAHEIDWEAGTAAIDFLNGEYTITASFETVEGGSSGAVQAQTVLHFDNADILRFDLDAEASAVDPDGLLWNGGSVTGTFVPVLFSGRTATHVTATFAGLAPRSLTDIPFRTTWTRGQLPGYLHAGPADNLTVTSVASGSAGPSSDGLLRYDGVAPVLDSGSVFVLTEQVLGDEVNTGSQNWLNRNYAFADGAPSGTDPGVGGGTAFGVVTTFHAGSASLAPAELGALDPVETADFPASVTNGEYTVIALLTDALGNSTPIPLTPGVVNTATTFGIDVTRPMGQDTVEAGTTLVDRRIYNANVGLPWTVETVRLNAMEDFSGFSLAPVAARLRAVSSEGTSWVPLPGTLVAPLSGQFVHQGFDFATVNTAGEAYYLWEAQVYNQAGLGSGVTTRYTYLYDETAPDIDNIGVQGSYEAGRPYSFTANATDNVDLLDAHFGIEYSGVLLPLARAQSFGEGWDVNGTVTSAEVTARIEHFIVAIELSGTGPNGGQVPAGAGALLPASWAQVVVRDVAGNESIQQNNFAAGTVAEGTSFDTFPAFANGDAEFFTEVVEGPVNLCLDADAPCTDPDLRTITVEARLVGNTSVWASPFDEVIFYYQDDVVPGSAEPRLFAVVGEPVYTQDIVTGTRTVTWRATLDGADVLVDRMSVPGLLPVMALGVNHTTGTATFASPDAQVVPVANGGVVAPPPLP